SHRAASCNPALPRPLFRHRYAFLRLHLACRRPGWAWWVTCPSFASELFGAEKRFLFVVGGDGEDGGVSPLSRSCRLFRAINPSPHRPLDISPLPRNRRFEFSPSLSWAFDLSCNMDRRDTSGFVSGGCKDFYKVHYS
ncbi:hypothetical protein ACMD2_04843, partial [Ananas comosus]